MRILDAKIEPIKKTLQEMFDEVLKQIIKSKSAIDTLDKNLAIEIIEIEPLIDQKEIELNEACEEFIAMYNPVADDLRCIMAINNITPSIERIGDIIEKIARYVKKYNDPLPYDLQEKFSIDELYETIITMYQKARKSFFDQSTSEIQDILDEDKKINKLNKKAKKTVLELIQNYPDKSVQSINLLLIISKIERIGDLIKNIAEEIAFYVDAKIIKHNK